MNSTVVVWLGASSTAELKSGSSNLSKHLLGLWRWKCNRTGSLAFTIAFVLASNFSQLQLWLLGYPLRLNLRELLALGIRRGK